MMDTVCWAMIYRTAYCSGSISKEDMASWDAGAKDLLKGFVILQGELDRKVPLLAVIAFGWMNVEAIN